MDLIFTRYSNPFDFLDVLIANGGLSQGVTEIWKFKNEDDEWQFFLHKVFDKTFDEFKGSIKANEPQKLTPKELETTVNTSQKMLQGFNPNESGG